MNLNKHCFVMLVCAGVLLGAPGWAAEKSAGSQGSCWFENPYNSEVECVEYVGDAWSPARAREDCRQRSSESAIEGQFLPGTCPSYRHEIGLCRLDSESERALNIHVYFSLYADEELQAICEELARGRYASVTD